MTSSIAAADRATGDAGAAGATRLLAVGADVLWAGGDRIDPAVLGHLLGERSRSLAAPKVRR